MINNLAMIIEKLNSEDIISNYDIVSNNCFKFFNICFINLKIDVSNLTGYANVLCKLPEKFQASGEVSLVSSTSNLKSYQTWVRSNGELVVNIMKDSIAKEEIRVIGCYLSK